MKLLLLETDLLGVTSVTGMLIFFAVFVGVVAWIATRSRGEVKHWAELPLDEELKSRHDAE